MESTRDRLRRLKKILRQMRRLGHRVGGFPMRCYICGCMPGVFGAFKVDGVLIPCEDGAPYTPVGRRRRAG